jgi:hypothetical protein
MSAYRRVPLRGFMKKRVKADKVIVVISIATLTLVAVVTLASPAFF